MAERRQSVAVELRLKAEAQAKIENRKKQRDLCVKFFIGLISFILLISINSGQTLAKDNKEVWDITAPRLEKLLTKKNILGVYWYKRKCEDSEEGLETIEKIIKKEETKKLNLEIVKINDKRFAKKLGIETLPALTIFKDESLDVSLTESLDKTETVFKFLIDAVSIGLQDKIEEVSVETLKSLALKESYVAALILDSSTESFIARDILENIDDEADAFEIRFVRVSGNELVDEYSLSSIPALVYYRQNIPLVYSGDLSDSSEVLEWLIQSKSFVSENDIVECINSDQQLEIMIQNVDYLLILFLDTKKKSKLALEALEEIDDELDSLGVSFISVDEPTLAQKLEVHTFPYLIFYENRAENSFDNGDITDAEDVLEWIKNKVALSVKEVDEVGLDKMIASNREILVYFYDDINDKLLSNLVAYKGTDALPILVKTTSKNASKEYGVMRRPSLVLFINSAPVTFNGNLAASIDTILDWIDSHKGQ